MLDLRTLRFSEHVERLAEDGPALLRRALQGGGTFADLFVEQSVHHRGAWRERVGGDAGRRNVVPVRRDLVAGASVRVLDGAEEGFASSEDRSPAGLRRLADEAAAGVSSPRGGGETSAGVTVREHGSLPRDAVDAIAASEKEAVVRAAAEAAAGLDGRVRYVSVHYRDHVRRAAVLTSDGTLAVHRTSMLGLRVEVTLEVEGRHVTGTAMAGGPAGFGYFFAHPPEETAREAVEQARRLVEARPLSPGTMPVVTAGGWGGVWLHEAVGHHLEADAMASERSPFAGCFGERVAPQAVTLVDDPTLPDRRGTMAVDDEGTPARRTVLVRDGVMTGLLTDRRHGGTARKNLTGHGRRQDYRRPPQPRMSNLVLRPGGSDLDELIGSVQEGLYVAVIGQGCVEPAAGTFAFDVVEGYRIERGRRTAPVTGGRVTGDAADVLQRVAGIGRTVTFDDARGLCRKGGQVVPVSIGMPPVLVAGMEVQDVSSTRGQVR